jgi:hypothetical protein
MTSISITLDVVRLRPDPEDTSGIPCPRCHHRLTLDQPDPQRPDRLLGRCDECRAWFLIHGLAGAMVRLPDEDELWGD